MATHTTTDTSDRVRPLDSPLPPVAFEYGVNPLVLVLLRSPLHRLISDRITSITFTGRRSGRKITVPVGYERRDDVLYVTSRANRTWWKNLRGGGVVDVLVGGERCSGTAAVFEDDRAVAEYVAGYLDRHGRPGLRRLGIAIDGEAPVSVEELAAGLSETVLVRIEISEVSRRPRHGRRRRAVAGA